MKAHSRRGARQRVAYTSAGSVSSPFLPSDQLLVAGLALLVRLIHVFAISDNPYFAHPIVDAQTYHQAALAIAAGDGHPDLVFWQPPGFPYLLGVLYRLFGSEPMVPRIFQSLLGALSAVLVYRIGVRGFGRSVGLAASIGLALYGTVFFFDGELLPVSLTIFLQLVAIELALIAQGRPRPLRWLLPGFVMGLASLATATTLLWVATLTVFARRQAPWVLVGAALAIAPATMRNLERGDEFVPISFNGGINLFLGNNPEYDQTVAIRPDRQWKALTAEPSREGIRGYNAQSLYFVDRVGNFLFTDPVGFLALQLKKTRLLLGGDEILRNHSIYPFREDSPLLRALLWKVPGVAFPWGLLVSLGLAGVVLRWRRQPLLAVLFVVYALGVIAFFITARYRLPLVPLLLLFAAELIRWWVIDAEVKARSVGALLLAFTFLMANFGQGAMPTEMNPDAKYSLAVQLADEGRETEALTLYREAIEEKPDYAEAWLNMGNILLASRQPAAAESAFARAAELDPLDADALVNLGNIRVSGDRLEEALVLYRKALVLKPRHPLAMENLETIARKWATIRSSDEALQAGKPSAEEVEIWRLLHEQFPEDPRFLGNLVASLEQRNELPQALEVVRDAVNRSVNDVGLRFTLGRLLILSGKRAVGIEEIRRARSLNPDLVDQWMENNVELRGLNLDR